MKYNIKEFDRAVGYYQKELKKIKFKSVFVYGIFNEQAFLSIAPLSRAIDELGKDLYVSFSEKKIDIALFDVWETFNALKNKKNNKKTRYLEEFIKIVDKKTKGRFNEVLKEPEIILTPEKGGFRGTLNIDYNTKWFRKYKWDKLKKTTDVMLKEVINPRKNENVSIGFELIPNRKFLDQPLEDYLDSFAISLSAINNSLKKYSLLKVASSSSRESMLDEPERISELSATLLGCELCKDIDEPVFKAYKRLSKELKLSRIKPVNAVFAIRGKGYSGRHYFGESIGYPTPDRKSRWDSPGGILYKFSWYPQSHVDSRKPQTRIGFTSTVPIDVFIDSVLVDYDMMRQRNKKITERLNWVKKVFVRSNINKGCNFEVGLVKKDGTRREIQGSDGDARCVVDPKWIRRGKYFGMMANIPGGETFTTPEYVKGRIVGDVVISLDRSYMLSPKKPLIIDVKNNEYKVISGDRKIIKKLNEKKKEAWKRLLEQEKNRNIPSKIVELKKSNFNKIGEFAINTNPKARLCAYLIVNEKIAKMIHVALGSGFEQDRVSEYHTDIVIDAPRQKMDIFGIDKKGKEVWILKKGKLLV